jgi:hypothetical protein
MQIEYKATFHMPFGFFGAGSGSGGPVISTQSDAGSHFTGPLL